MRVGFTGTRKLTPEGRALARARLLALRDGLSEEVTEVTTGGASGIDQYVAGQMRALFPDAFHRLVLPKDYDERWVARFEEGIAKGFFRGEVIRTGLSPLKRNHVILDHSDVLEGFPAQATMPLDRNGNPSRAGGGTWATIRYAWARDIPVAITTIGEEE